MLSPVSKNEGCGLSKQISTHFGLESRRPILIGFYMSKCKGKQKNMAVSHNLDGDQSEHCISDWHEKMRGRADWRCLLQWFGTIRQSQTWIQKHHCSTSIKNIFFNADGHFRLPYSCFFLSLNDSSKFMVYIILCIHLFNYMGCPKKKYSIKVKKKCTKKWRCLRRELKIWYMYKNIMGNLFTRKYFSYIALYSWYSHLNV